MNNLEWNSINWPLVEHRVFRYQNRIYRASQDGNKWLVHNLQQRLLKSFDSKLLAVRQVTKENKEKKTPSVDMKLYETSKDKIKLVSRLKLDGKTNPIRKLEIAKPGSLNQNQSFCIAKVEDRAKQALCRMALEPEWEACFEQDSYGFRPGRNCQDAIEAAFEALSTKRQQPEYQKLVLKVDIEKCFDRITQNLLLEKLNSIPIIQNQVKAWLQAGILEKTSLKQSLESLIKNEMGTPHGEIISPLLSNIALHGLINHLKEWVISISAKNHNKVAKQSALTVIRYIDDILIIHKEKSLINQAKNEIEKWLWENCKLTINQEKTKIYSSTQGFDFLGFTLITIRRNGINRIKIYPSRSGQAQILLNLREIIQKNKAASSYRLISLLKPKIIGWGNYYRYSECKQVFSKISHYIHQKLRAWMFRIDKRHGRQEVKEKYFPSGKTYYFNNFPYQDNWIFYGTEKDENGKIKETFLPKLTWIKFKKWIKVKGTKSPFDGDNIYWAVRMISYKRLPTRVSKLLKLQKGFCPYCRTRFYLDSVMEVDHIQPKALGGKDIYANLQLLHQDCHVRKTRTDKVAIAEAKARN